MAHAMRAVEPDSDIDLLTASFLTRYSATRTIEAYDYDLRCFRQWCATRQLDPLAAHRRDIELYARSMEADGLAKRTRNRRLGTIGMFFKMLVLDGIADTDPTANVRRPRVERESSTNGLRRTELADMLEAAERRSPTELAVVCLLGLNGLRVSEACSLDIENLSAERGMGTIRFVRKGGKIATAPLSPMTKWAIDQATAGRTSGPILLNQLGLRMNRQNASLIVHRLAEMVGITKRISPHSLRHSFVTLSLDAGVSQRDVQNSTGHSDPRMVLYYDRNRENLQRHATHTLTAYVAGSL